MLQNVDDNDADDNDDDDDDDDDDAIGRQLSRTAMSFFCFHYSPAMCTYLFALANSS